MSGYDVVIPFPNKETAEGAAKRIKEAFGYILDVKEEA